MPSFGCTKYRSLAISAAERMKKCDFLINAGINTANKKQVQKAVLFSITLPVGFVDIGAGLDERLYHQSIPTLRSRMQNCVSPANKTLQYQGTK
jgi:hypothetical protein